MKRRLKLCLRTLVKAMASSSVNNYSGVFVQCAFMADITVILKYFCRTIMVLYKKRDTKAITITEANISTTETIPMAIPFAIF